MKRKLVVLFTVLALAAVVSGLWCIMPPGLHLHVGIAWERVTVDYSNRAEPYVFHSPMQRLHIPTVTHGVYRIGVQLADGHTVWSQFFQYDAGVRQRVDLFIEGSTQPGHVHIRETYNRLNVLFEGDIRPEEPSREKPLTLDWI